MSRIVKRGYDADAIKWVVTRGYSIGAPPPALDTGDVLRVGIRRGLSVSARRGVSVGARRGLRVGIRS